MELEPGHCVRAEVSTFLENDLQSPVIETHLERGSEKSRGEETCTVKAHKTRIKRETTARANNSIKHDKESICPRDKDLARPSLLGDTEYVGIAGDARAPSSVCVCINVWACVSVCSHKCVTVYINGSGHECEGGHMCAVGGCEGVRVRARVCERVCDQQRLEGRQP